MSATRAPSTVASIRVAARSLAADLTIARRYLAVYRPRVCCDCGSCFVVASASSPLRCWRCGIARADDVPTDGPSGPSCPPTCPDECPDHGHGGGT